MEVFVLASGSSGNAALIRAAGSTVLVDVGVSAMQVRRRLEFFGCSYNEVDAILLTHEHGDHVRGLQVLLRRREVPVWATPGTWSQLPVKCESGGELGSGHELKLGELEVLPVTTSHDAREPVGFVFSDGDRRVGWVTDTGVFTPLLEQRLCDCDGLFIEANHDADMLRHGPYPWPLKQRIASRLGHLGNHQTADALDRMRIQNLRTLVALHLSAENNRAEMVKDALGPALPEETLVRAVTRGEMVKAVFDGDNVSLSSAPVPPTQKKS